MAKGVRVGGRWVTGFSVSGVWRRVCSRHGRSVRCGARTIMTKRRQKKSQVSPSVLLPTDGGVGGEKGKCPAQLVQGSQRQNQLQRSRTGPSLSGLGAELDWLQGPVIKVKSQHSGPDSRKPNLTCPLQDSSAVSQPGCSSSSLDSCRRTGSRQRRKATGCRSESGADEGMLLLEFMWNRKIWNQHVANSQ